MPLKAVAFDVDGTLYPNASMYLRSLGLALSHLRLLKALEDVRTQLRQVPDTSDDFHRVQARLLGARLGLSADRAYALVEARVYTRWYRIFKHLKPYQGVAETIEAFRGAGLKIGVLSDFPIRHRLTDLGLPGPYDCAFSSEETGLLKPHPQAFEELARRLNLPPSEILYVGNSYRYDVLGALAAGMPCAHLSSKRRPDSRAVLTFQRYAQLRDFVFQSVQDPGYDRKTGRISV